MDKTQIIDAAVKQNASYLENYKIDNVARLLKRQGYLNKELETVQKDIDFISALTAMPEGGRCLGEDTACAEIKRIW